MTGQTSTLITALHNVLTQVAEPAHVLKLILDQAVGLTGADRGLLAEVNRDGALEFEVLHQIRRGDLVGPGGRISRTIFSHVRKSGVGLRLEDARLSPMFGTAESVAGMGLVAVLCLPLLEDGEVVALLHLEGTRPGHFSATHEALVRSLLDVAEPVYRALRAGRQVMEERDRLRLQEEVQSQEIQESRRVLARAAKFGRFIGRSPRLFDLQQDLLKAAGRDFPVMLLGESGTGKSLLARALHSAGPRAERPFVTVFCPSLNKEMVEAELFGHKKGTFTSALSDRAGKVQVADGGTLFLDEIGELPLEIQPKLLRLLQEKTYERVGDAQERRADVRIVTATNRDIEEEVRVGTFRRDLFERLNFVPLWVPPLRERRDDIPLLLRHCLDQIEDGRWIELSPAASELLTSPEFGWTGNARTVEQLAARLVLDGETPVSAERLRRFLKPGEPGASEPGAAVAPPLRPVSIPGAGGLNIDVEIRRAERRCLEGALRLHPRATRNELAEILGIKPSTLYKKLKDHGLGTRDNADD